MQEVYPFLSILVATRLNIVFWRRIRVVGKKHFLDVAWREFGPEFLVFMVLSQILDYFHQCDLAVLVVFYVRWSDYRIKL